MLAPIDDNCGMEYDYLVHRTDLDGVAPFTVERELEPGDVLYGTQVIDRIEDDHVYCREPVAPLWELEHPDGLLNPDTRVIVELHDSDARVGATVRADGQDWEVTGIAPSDDALYAGRLVSAKP